ncbi:putative serine/threonine protein kinase [Talaromyces proteolyticus]|uniref:non-specific serine/threonine protein kinase n=1 Tax=Talaromyces proteolyticus TaxID=1131652 RepID=A0AAD4KTD9_9EURO|nr:putative serine/threonine protein kinase [Talaromyces proteolyticus]KAH8695510.1 putative serine/threonine protein kinase [Talaromyces proteolyticus]
MDGDLSLSQSLGGLRIANPDDAPLPSDEARAALLPSSQPHQHPLPLPAESQQNYSLPLITGLDGVKSDFGTDSVGDLASSYKSQVSSIDTAASRRPTNRSSVAYLPDSHSTSQHHQSAIPRSASTHVHNNHYANGTTSAAAAVRELNNYRIRTDSSASGAEKMYRSDSRGGSAALQAGVLSRDNSHSDRSYKQSQYMPGNGPVPLRQGSRLGHGTASSGSPYSLENGPPTSSEDWQDRGAAVGVRQEVDANGRTVSRYIKKGVRDFSFGQTLGEGSYSTVCLATDRQTLNEYAIKILDKRHIIKEKKVKYVNIEKDTLNRLTDHPGIVRLYYTFQDERSLYFVLDLCKNGELLGVLKRMVTFDEECTQFYCAQILDTIDYMHKRGVIHRDLKPENILLDSQMHTKITDFGTAKILNTPKKTEDSFSDVPSLDTTDLPEEDRASSFVGTAEYVSPELLTDKNACKASDLWAFGCIVFQLLAGRPPFKAANEYLTFQKIVALEYEFPAGFPPVARDLVERLLVLDPARRLPIEHIKNHEFFDGIAWGRGLWKQKAPRLKPYVPPAREPIKLNGGDDADSFPPNISAAPSGAATPNSRAYPRVITELPPPSQLDIEWSPVLSKNNERILKLGNLTVYISPAPHSPAGRSGNGDPEPSKKFSRFFGSGITKKKQRLVMITSSARIILAPAGGDDKRVKIEIPLLAPDTTYRSNVDAKGSASWVVTTRDKHFVFEESSKAASSSSQPAATSTQEWIDALDRAKDIAMSQQSSTYSADEYRDLSSAFSSQANTIDHSSEFHHQNESGAVSGRTTLQKHQAGDTESIKGKKRFSKRHSKNGLAAVF